MINRKQFVRRFAEKYGVTYQDADQICRNFFDLMCDIIYDEKEDLVITGFGSFKHRTAKAKNVRHPVTGVMTKTKAKDVVKFTVSELFSDDQESEIHEKT